MPKVLVLCQRRNGEGTEGIPEAIDRLSRHLLGDNVEITYLTTNTNYKGIRSNDGDMDMSFVFGHNKETERLGRDYDLIINHQCPAARMNYKRIHLHLKKEGYLAIASYDRVVVTTPAKLRHFSEENGSYRMIQEAGFHEAKIDPSFGALLFQKDSHDYTKHFSEVPYETNIFDPEDHTPETEADRERYLENMRAKEKEDRAEARKAEERKAEAREAEERKATCAIFVGDDVEWLQCMEKTPSFQIVSVKPADASAPKLQVTAFWDTAPQLPASANTPSDGYESDDLYEKRAGSRKRSRKKRKRKRKTRK